MADPVTALVVGSTVLGVGSKVYEAKSAKKAGSQEAQQHSLNAHRARLEGRSRAQEERRQTARLMSDAQAAQAASGFSASDMQAIKQRGDISGAGKYNELAYLYESEMDAQGLLRAGRNAEKTGKRRATGAYIGAASTAIGGARDYYSR